MTDTASVFPLCLLCLEVRACVLLFQLYIDFLWGNGEIVFGSQRMWSMPQGM